MAPQMGSRGRDAVLAYLKTTCAPRWRQPFTPSSIWQTWLVLQQGAVVVRSCSDGRLPTVAECPTYFTPGTPSWMSDPSTRRPRRLTMIGCPYHFRDVTKQGDIRATAVVKSHTMKTSKLTRLNLMTGLRLLASPLNWRPRFGYRFVSW